MAALRQEPDGRLVVVQTPAPAGWYTFGCGRMDNPDAVPPESPNGTGNPLVVQFGGPGTDRIEIALVQPIYLHNGQAYFRGSWGLGDEWSVGVMMPATTFAEGGARDVETVDLGGGLVAWKPVQPGKGTHTFEQSKAIPVPAKGGSPVAFWNVNPDTSDVLPVYGNPTGTHMLLSVAVESYFFRSIPVPGDGEFEAPTFQSEWISQRWKPFVSVTKASDGAGSMAAWLMTFRQDTR